MPAHWEPWPGKTKAMRDSPAGRPRTTFGAVSSPSARAVSAAVRAAGPVAVTTARSSSAARPVARVCAMSGTGSVAVARWSRRRRAWAARPWGPLPESTSGSGPVQAGSAARGSVAGAASTMTWALVPLMPKEETAARRGSPSAGQSRASRSSSTAPASQSTWVVGWSACRVLGSRPCRMAITILMTPATPAAAWVCPMLDLTEPSQSGSARSWP